MNIIKKTIKLPDGREITIETGKLAKQADGAVEVRMGNTMLLATVVTAKEAGEGVDFMPLQVEYKEKFSAAGRFPGGFLKREGRASDYEVLTARLVDRVLRPLFPDNYHADTFVNIILLNITFFSVLNKCTIPFLSKTAKLQNIAFSPYKCYDNNCNLLVF